LSNKLVYSVTQNIYLLLGARKHEFKSVRGYEESGSEQTLAKKYVPSLGTQQFV